MRATNTRFCLSLLACLAAGPALADGPAAARSLLANLKAGGQDIGGSLADLHVSATLVRGVYALYTVPNRLVGFTNEEGTLFGDVKGFNGQFGTATPFRPLTLEEAAALRREMAERIDKTRLITVRYGAGQMQVFMFSAIDCPYCKSIEGKLRDAKSENSTFHVIPSSLQSGRSRQGAQQWQKVAAIWCAADAAQAWRNYWATGMTPAGAEPACPFADPMAAERAYAQLWGMFQGVGVKLTGTPSYLRMDGTKFTSEALRKPLEPERSARWLGHPQVPAADAFRPRPVGF